MMLQMRCVLRCVPAAAKSPFLPLLLLNASAFSSKASAAVCGSPSAGATQHLTRADNSRAGPASGSKCACSCSSQCSIIGRRMDENVD